MMQLLIYLETNFIFFLLQGNEENLNNPLLVPQYSINEQPHQQSVNQTYHEMSDQTFHTPSFGDEEFDIPVMHHQSTESQHHQLDQYQMHGHPMGLMNDQQIVYNQWHQQQQPTPESHMMTNQSYQLQSPNHSNFQHISSPNQQLHMIQQPLSSHQPTTIGNHHQQPQISPQLSATCNSFIGQSPTQGVRSNENPSTSDESDDNVLNDPNNAFKHPSSDPFADGDLPKGNTAKKTKTVAKKTTRKKKDPNEPQKPVTPYALFFRDTQAAIKGQNPNASFGEVSKIVASMWDVLAPEHKNVYKKKTEAAKKDYLKALAVYRANLVSQGSEELSASNQQAALSPTQNNIQLTSSPAPLLTQAPSISSPQQMQNFPTMTQTYQQSFVNQTLINQNTMTQNTMMNMPQQQQTGSQNQFMNQQIHQISQQPSTGQQHSNVSSQQINNNNNNNQMPPVTVTPTVLTPTQNCIRSGCKNPAIVSIDWEDEYCSNECVTTHCKDVFANWVQAQSTSQQQQQNFPTVK
ncbi:CLUMA_CG009916, isoform A [Clunio marinus]|uniref:CLUMA_CG009916, isoform A n=1 Tax=Clunio marinus TaxID=568069 RepID=A0A1J1I928_9DIPT|nr:CLUMA_CG009916, isoform A [Clunio marinus]